MQAKLHPYFFGGLLLAVFVIVFFLFKPFIAPIVLALTISIVATPVYERFLRLIPNAKGLASLFTVIVVSILVLVPIMFFGYRIADQAQNVYISVTSTGSGGLGGFVETTINKIGEILPLPSDYITSFTDSLAGYFESFILWIFDNFGSVFSSVAKFLFSIFIGALALYYFLRDGHAFKKYLIALSPLSDEYDNQILDKLANAASSVVKGVLTIALIQAFLVGVGLWIFGVPNPILWGSIAMIGALIPGLGTAIIVVPAVGYLFWVGSMVSAIGLLLWGMFAVGLIDNFLSPKLIGRGMNIHPFLTLISVIGGLSFFGPVGFILGPLSLSFLFALLDIYQIKTKEGASQGI